MRAGLQLEFCPRQEFTAVADLEVKSRLSAILSSAPRWGPSALLWGFTWNMRPEDPPLRICPPLNIPSSASVCPTRRSAPKFHVKLSRSPFN